MAEEHDGDEREMMKLFFELAKHSTTIAAGALILMATFLDKFFHNKESLLVARAAATAFVLSIGGSLSSMGYIALSYGHPQNSLMGKCVRAIMAIIGAGAAILLFLAFWRLSAFIEMNLAAAVAGK